MADTTSAPAFPARWLWAFPPVYLLHLIDERFWGPGTASWATTHTGIYFTNTAWLFVNVPSFILLTLSAALTARRSWPDWVAIALATHLTLHAGVRIIGSVVTGVVSPGVATGVALCLPLAIVVFVRGLRVLPMERLRTGLIAGVLSFQPLWHMLLLAFLPGPPPAG